MCDIYNNYGNNGLTAASDLFKDLFFWLEFSNTYDTAELKTGIFKPVHAYPQSRF